LHHTLRKHHIEHVLHLLSQQEDAFLEHAIVHADNETTAMTKADQSNPLLHAADAHHNINKLRLNLVQRGCATMHNITSSLCPVAQCFSTTKHVCFANKHTVHVFSNNTAPVVVATYNSGADGHYLSERDRIKAGLPILCPSSKCIRVANGHCSHGKNMTALPFSSILAKAVKADTFDEFPNSLISVGRILDDNTISIFTKDGITVHQEQDVLITCQGEPILIGVCHKHGRYHTPLIQQKGQWQPHPPRKRINKKLCEANSIYDFPSIEQAIKWMHAVCGYPIKSIGIKAINAGNFIGWPLLTKKNVNKYYHDADETQQGHMNQTRKNVRSTK